MELPSIPQGHSLTRLLQGAAAGAVVTMIVIKFKDLDQPPVTVPHYICENKSDMRGIKSGWYAMDDDGNLSSGPFSSHEESLSRGTQPTNGSTPSKLRLRPA